LNASLAETSELFVDEQTAQTYTADREPISDRDRESYKQRDEPDCKYDHHDYSLYQF
jgi:hypothetical protein